MTVAMFFAGSAKRNVLQNRDAVFNDGGLADDDSGAMIEHDACADVRSGMDIDGEYAGSLTG